MFSNVIREGSTGEPVNRQNSLMPRKRRPINAKLIEYVCDCGWGVYRLKMKSPFTSDCRHTWLHACTGCENELEFTVPYPLIEVQSGLRARLFILNDAKPVASVNRSEK